VSVAAKNAKTSGPRAGAKREFPKRKIDPELLQEWLEEGLNQTTIAQKFGVSDSAVRQAIKRFSFAANKPPKSITGRMEIASIPDAELSTAAMLDLRYMWFNTMARAKTLPLPFAWKELNEVKSFIRSSYDTASKLFGWDAKNSGSGGAINVNILAQAGNTKPVATIDSSVLDDNTTMPVLSAAKKDTPTLGKEPGAGHKELEQGAGAKHPFSDDEREEGEGEPLSGEGSTER